jgi:hypothetical protein
VHVSVDRKEKPAIFTQVLDTVTASPVTGSVANSLRCASFWNLRAKCSIPIFTSFTHSQAAGSAFAPGVETGFLYHLHSQYSPTDCTRSGHPGLASSPRTAIRAASPACANIARFRQGQHAPPRPFPRQLRPDQDFPAQSAAASLV